MMFDSTAGMWSMPANWLCDHSHVEYHWLNHQDGTYSSNIGDVVCHHCRRQLRYTTPINFYNYLLQTGKQYVKPDVGVT